MTEFVDRFWSSRDGLKLHFRDYPANDGAAGRPPVICLPGLTRNARDFASLATRLSGEWRVLCPEMRGRGDSAYAKDSSTYNPLQYIEDLGELLAQEGIDRFVAIGTSLGGLMTMAIAMIMPERLAGAVLNDVGPYIEPEGLRRIGSYVGQGRSFPTWMHAARELAEMQGAGHPEFALGDWLAQAKRLMTLSSNGRVVFDYDMKIAELFVGMDPENQADLWPGIDNLAGRPVLFLRGVLSDVLSAATLTRMQRRLPEAEAVTITRIGHAPTLDEPQATAAIDRLLARVV